MRYESFDKLLRWYPRKWRDRNGEVFVTTLLDQAEAEGRKTPSASERRSAAVYGLGTRLSTRLALWCAVLALICVVAAAVRLLWGLHTATAIATDSGVDWQSILLTAGLCPFLVGAGVFGVSRDHGLISEPRAVAALALLAPALGFGVFSASAWGVGFDAADAGTPVPAFADAWVWFFLAAWTLGAAALALFFFGLLRRTRLNRAIAIAIAILAGALCAPVIGITLLSPFAAGSAAIALGVTALIAGGGVRVEDRAARAAQQPPPQCVPSRQAAPTLDPRVRVFVRQLCAVTTAVSVFGVVYAFTGSLWFAYGPDATIAMRQGMTISWIGALPLLAALGLLLSLRSRLHPAHSWGPIILFAASLVSMAAGHQASPGSDDLLWLIIAAGLNGAAVAWWAAVRLPGSGPARLTIAVLGGAVWAASAGVFLLMLSAFAVPLGAAALMIWTPSTGARGPNTGKAHTAPRPVNEAVLSA